MQDIELLQGNCLEVMKYIPDKSIDLILTDPPYLMNYKTNRRKNKEHDFCNPIQNDDNEEVVKKSIVEMARLLKDTGALYVFCNANKIEIFKKIISELFIFKNILIWVKNNHTAGDLKGAYGKKTEFIIYATKGKHYLNGKRDTDVLFYNKVSGKRQIHQNEKPIDLLEFIISKSSNINDIVLDCFMGSGTTGAAAKNLNRRFIGIELEKEYFEIAKKRIESPVKLEIKKDEVNANQLSLF